MRKLLLLVGLGLSLSLSAQHAILSVFNGTVSGDQVFLEWTVIKGSICAGIIIERAEPNSEFVAIGEIEGICGNIESAEYYSFIDKSPLSGVTSRYRLLLGNYGYTTEISINYFELNGDQFNMYYRPQNEEIQLVSNEISSVRRLVTVYNYIGTVVLEFEMKGNQEIQSIQGLNAGAYTIQIIEDNKVLFTRQFVKQI